MNTEIRGMVKRFEKEHGLWTKPVCWSKDGTGYLSCADVPEGVEVFVSKETAKKHLTSANS